MLRASEPGAASRACVERRRSLTAQWSAPATLDAERLTNTMTSPRAKILQRARCAE